MSARKKKQPSRIGTQNESTIHSQIKKMYRCPGSRTEVPHGQYLVDVDRGDGELVEVQTTRFGLIRNKLRFLLASHRVRLVYPLTVRKELVFRNPDSGLQESKRRKSPKSKTLIDLTDELVGIAPLLSHPRLSLEVLFTTEEELRCRDGKGSWRRRGTSILDRKLMSIEGSVRFCAPEDYLKAFLPQGAPVQFTNHELADYLGVRYRKAQQLTYCLRALGVIMSDGKKGRGYLYRLNGGDAPGRA